MSETALPDFVWITEIDDHTPIRDLFMRKFGGEPPQSRHHHVAWLRLPDGAWRPACYAHVEAFGDIGLLGGACTDGDVLRQLSDQQRAQIDAAGGLYRHLLAQIFATAARRFDAVFGYCGNARAWEIGIGAGFVATGHSHLRVRFMRELHPVLQNALIAKAHALGAF